MSAVLDTQALDGDYQMRKGIATSFGRILAVHRPIESPLSACHIWGVVEATCAAPRYSSAADINGDVFVVVGFGTNNSTREALSEFFGPRKDSSKKAVIISIGLGLTPQTRV